MLERLSKSSSPHTKKIFLVGRFRFFVSDVISRGCSGHLGLLHLAQGPWTQTVRR